MSGLTERQQEIARDLLELGAERPMIEPGLAAELKAKALSEIGALGQTLKPGAKVFASKARLDYALACDELYRLRTEPGSFTPSRPTVLGALTHRVIELLIVDQQRHPVLELAHEALAEACADGADNAPFLNALTLPERIDIVRDVCDAVTKFVADWPPIDAAWSPRVESSITVAVGRIKINVRPDLLLGIPRGDRSRTFIADFKRGDQYPAHRAHTHFYALADTLRSRVAPYRVATYYLDAGEFVADAVTPELLEAALRRTVAGIERMVLVENGEVPERRAGRSCNFCPARDDCDVLVAHRERERLEAADDLAYDDYDADDDD